jgi:exonuclease VII large subunit
MVIRAEPAATTSDVHVKPSISMTSFTDGSGSNNIVFEDSAASSSSGEPKATTSNPRVIGSVSDVLDATSKAIENVGNEIACLSEAADELVSSLRMQRDNFVSQSKGKARALSEQIQNLNEEMVYRNERAKTRARKLKKRGEEMLLNTREMLMKRTEKAKRRAKELGKSVLESDAWVTYQKVQEEMESRLSGGGGGDKKGQMGKQRKSKRGKENAKACRKESRRLLRSKRKVLTDEHCI